MISSIQFPGRDRLLRSIDGAVRLRDPETLTQALKGVLHDAIQDPAIQLPACLARSLEGRYARRELHRSDTLGYSVVAMCWGPGQHTPLHDHDAHWCVEGVWQGALTVVPHALLERDGDRWRFEAQAPLAGHAGSAGSLIPPHEFHTLSNASGRDVAVSLHVYEAPLERCAVFDPLGDGWYQRRMQALSTDAA